MRICIVGKFPPIQGGVSTRTYWTAHALAARGHDVHVVTNAKEAVAPFRMHMRRQDWKRCEATYDAGSVTVHWTDPVDRSQFYIPISSPFVSKLAGTAARVHAEHPFDVIYSHYLEPYGVAGHLAAQIAGVPHVVRFAGSDAGRLWHHPQLEVLYDHVLRSAALVIATGSVAGRAIKRGVSPRRIVSAGGFTLPEDLFHPDGTVLDLAALRREVAQDPEIADMLWGGFTGDRPYLGIYGKLGETKGSFALLAALQRLAQAGLDIGLVAMAHGWPAMNSKFRSRVEELGLTGRVLQIPFLPHWRVPEFLRSCLAVCCLEQDFPIVFHTPVVAREVLTCGACLVGSTEVIRKLPDYWRLPHGYGCVAVEDVQDVELLSSRLAALVKDPTPIGLVAQRGRAFARAAQSDARFPDTIERLLKTAARRRLPSSKGGHASGSTAGRGKNPRFTIAQLTADRLAKQGGTDTESKLAALPSGPIDLPRARDVLAETERCLADGDASLGPVAAAIKLEIAIAEAERAADDASPRNGADPLFRLRTTRWAMLEDDLGRLIPVLNPRLRMITFDASALRDGQADSAGETQGMVHVVVFAQAGGEGRDPLFVSAAVARILELSDGTRTVREIAAASGLRPGRAASRRFLEEIEGLFVSDLLCLQEAPDNLTDTVQPDSAVTS